MRWFFYAVLKLVYFVKLQRKHFAPDVATGGNHEEEMTGSSWSIMV